MMKKLLLVLLSFFALVGILLVVLYLTHSFSYEY